jgi:hypothetical protein
MKQELKQKQAELKEWLKKLGLSQNIFGERLFYHVNESDNEEEINQFIERFKKAINRDSTDIKLIETYLEFLFEQNEFMKLGLIKSTFYYEDEFTEDFNWRMKNISKNITERIVSQERDDESV